MKITALLVLKCDVSEPLILANATDVSHYGHLQRSSYEEAIVLISQTVAKQTPPSHRQSVLHQGYRVYICNRNGLCALGFMNDDHDLGQTAFLLLNQVLDEYTQNFGDSWRHMQSDNTQPWPYLSETLAKFQDPAETDKLLVLQRELDEKKRILHMTIDSILDRGEKHDNLAYKSSDLSAASQIFYQQARKSRTEKGCMIL